MRNGGQVIAHNCDDLLETETESALLSFLATEGGEALHLLIGLKERESEFRFSLISRRIHAHEGTTNARHVSQEPLAA